MTDAVSGLDLSSLSVTADFTIDKDDPGRELSSLFRQVTPGVWELRLKTPIQSLSQGKLTVQIADQDRNVSRVERTFSVGATGTWARLAYLHEPFRTNVAVNFWDARARMQ